MIYTLAGHPPYSVWCVMTRNHRQSLLLFLALFQHYAHLQPHPPHGYMLHLKFLKTICFMIWRPFSSFDVNGCCVSEAIEETGFFQMFTTTTTKRQHISSLLEGFEQIVFYECVGLNLIYYRAMVRYSNPLPQLKHTVNVLCFMAH